MITGVSGARGLVGSEFTAAACLELAGAFAAGRPAGPLVIGRDTRPSGVMAAAAVSAALLEAGHPVCDLGICPTPAVEFAVPALAAAGGVIITASHNPAEWNGLKFLDEAGLFLSPEASDRVYRASARTTTAGVPAARRQETDILPRYLEQVVALVDRALVARRGFRVAVDAVNGAAWAAAPDLLERLGATASLVHCDDSGNFARPAEPRAEHLGDLAALVRRSGADLGLAYDPDGDRLALVDENGRPLSEELTLALCVDAVLARQPGPVVINMSTSMITEVLARRYRVPVYRAPVGEYHVARRMAETGAPIGGEGNGGVIYPACHPGRDGLMAAALLLEYLAERKISLSTAAGRLPAAAMVKEKIPRPAYGLDEVDRRIRRLYPDRQPDSTDGLRVAGDDWWFQVRYSNTEPIARIFAEAADLPAAAAIVDRLRAALAD